MSNVELTVTQKSALAAFQSKGQMTQLRLSVVLCCEKALARNVTLQLVEMGLVTDYKNGQFNINAAGKAALKIPSGKTTFKVIEETPALDEVVLADLQHQQNLAVDAAAQKIAPEAVHSLPAADTSEPEPARKVLVVPPEQADALAEKLTPLVELNQDAPADFETLVRQGLARLNAQLGMQPVHIDGLDLKLEVLEVLAESIGGTNELQVYAVLKAIKQDLQRIAARSS